MWCNYYQIPTTKLSRILDSDFIGIGTWAERGGIVIQRARYTNNLLFGEGLVSGYLRPNCPKTQLWYNKFNYWSIL